MKCELIKGCTRDAIAFVTTKTVMTVPACRECGLDEQIKATNEAQALGVSPQFQLDEIIEQTRPVSPALRLVSSKPGA